MLQVTFRDVLPCDELMTMTKRLYRAMRGDAADPGLVFHFVISRQTHDGQEAGKLQIALDILPAREAPQSRRSASIRKVKDSVHHA